METTTPVAPAGAPRATWGSKLAFIFAAAGSAIGLGNIWGFPTVAAQNGGAAFLVIYLIAVIFIGAPVLLAEVTIGRRTLRNPVGAFKELAPGTAWVALGGLGVLTGVVILSFYSVIAGWTIAYIWKVVTGEFVRATETGAIFQDVAGNAGAALFYHALFMAVTVYVVVGGVRDGIERWTKVLMPMLGAILLLLVARAVTLEGAGPGLEFYFRPDFSKVTGSVILAAVGQAFFSLSLGMGAMITYGSYVSKKDDLVSSSLWVALLDTSIAVFAGLIIFPTLFHAGLTPGEGGPGMVFVVLTSLLKTIPPAPYGGIVFGFLFFSLLFIAALTSSISLLEVGTAYFVDEKKVDRKKAALTLGAVALVLGIPSALGNGAVAWLSDVPGVGMGFLDLLFTIFGQYSLVVGALLISVFTAWVWGVDKADAEVRAEGGEFRSRAIWNVLIRYVAPVALALMLIDLVRRLL